jgi:hypothetical protein
VARRAFKLRAELVERAFALVLDRGGIRRVWLRGRKKVQKRYLIHVAGYNLGLIMWLLTGSGTPRELWPAAQAQCSGISWKSDQTGAKGWPIRQNHRNNPPGPCAPAAGRTPP